MLPRAVPSALSGLASGFGMGAGRFPDAVTTETLSPPLPVAGFAWGGRVGLCVCALFIYSTSRMDYLSSHINNHGCALCVEKGLQIEIPERAKVIRVLMDELTRIASHELWWGAMAMDLGAFTPFFLAFRERETITSIMEETCGARLTMNYNVPSSAN